MDLLWNELTVGVPDGAQAIRIVVRVFVATLAGAIVGYERERTGKAAGLRTHMIVALSSAIFVLGPLEAGMSESDVSRVVQGVAAGVGFLGAGTILKLTGEGEVRGLTTAAGIWLTAAVGIAAGLGRVGLAVLCALLAWGILAILARFEVQLENNSERALKKRE
jgi:putative Mg2+ transporter-C (MgtC) family protein